MKENPQPVIDQKVVDIRRAFGPAIGARLASYSTAEVLHEDATWGAWPDLPIRLEWDSGHRVAVSWSKFDDLWIAAGSSVPWANFDNRWIAIDSTSPFTIDGTTARWVTSASESLNRVVGAALLSVALGRGEMSVGGHDIEVWTRLLLETDRGWLEIFNALDENGYDHHTERPSGALAPCF